MTSPPSLISSSTTGTGAELAVRPKVAAHLRLASWAPKGQTRLSFIPSPLYDKLAKALASALQDSTLRTYGTGLDRFLSFCDDLQVPETERAPCSSDLIAAFVASLIGSYSHSAIRNYVAGVRAWHKLHRIPWRVDEDQLNLLFKAAERSAPDSAKRSLRQPFTPDLIAQLRAQLDLTSPLDAAVFACLTTCFYTCARLGEFTIPSTKSFDPHRHITPANTRVDTDRNGCQVQVFHLPSTKCNSSGEDTHWASQSGPSDPQWALHNHMQINCPPADGPLFAYRQGDTHVGLSKPIFLRRLATASKAAGLPLLQGHSLRIGGTLEYLLRGIPFDVVKSIGRWASDAFTLYLRRHAQVLAPYLQSQPAVLAEFHSRQIAMPPLR